MAPKLTIVGISGSLRKGSYNSGLLRIAERSLPENVSLKILPLDDLPIYNADIEKPLPAAVKAFKDAVKAADGLLIATPEYNYSTSGVLKNAIDWLSRPYGDNSVDGKPVALMGASMAVTGTARAQYHLRQMFVYLNGHLLNRPEVMVPSAHEKFDGDGNTDDAKTKEKVTELVMALLAWIERLRK